ncbi:MAG: DUF4402 domain-containing protein [Bacillota bacterium]
MQSGLHCARQGTPPGFRGFSLARAAVAGVVLLMVGLAIGSSVVNAQTAISVSVSADLRFGDIVPGSTSGTVTIDPAGARTVSGGVIALGESYGAASFTVSGEPGYSYTVTLPLSATLASGTNSMVVDTFTSSLDPDGVGTLDANGNGTFTVGATLHVDAGQAPGTYSGSFDVSVDYQ